MTELERLRGENVAMREALQHLKDIYIPSMNFYAGELSIIEQAYNSSELSARYMAVVRAAETWCDGYTKIHDLGFTLAGISWEEWCGIVESLKAAVDALRVARGGGEG